MIAPEFLCLLMVVVLCVALLIGYPVAFTLSGVSLIFAGVGISFGVFDPALLSALPSQIFGVMTNPVLTAVPLFLLMGIMLERAKVAEDMILAAGKLLGNRTGGLGFVVVLTGGLLAASTGVVGASVTMLGLLALPSMLKAGYRPSFAAGTIAATGSLGQIIPPSILLVFLGDQISAAYQSAQLARGNFAPDSVSVNDLFAAALMPGLLLLVFYALYVAYVSWGRPEDVPPLRIAGSQDAGGEINILTALSLLCLPVLLILVVLGSIITGTATPTEAAALGAIGSVLLAGWRLDRGSRAIILFASTAACLTLIIAKISPFLQSLPTKISIERIVHIFAAICLLIFAYGVIKALFICWREKCDDGERLLTSVLHSTLVMVAMIFAIVIGARLFSLVFRGFGGSEVIEEFLSTLPGGTLGAIIMVMMVMFVMGFFLDFLEIIFVVVPIAAPILLTLAMPDGSYIHPLWLAIMIAINLQASFLTPPFGIALFYLRGVAPAHLRTSAIYRGIIPFVGLQLFLLILLWFFPGLATWLPHLS